MDKNLFNKFFQGLPLAASMHKGIRNDEGSIIGHRFIEVNEAFVSLMLLKANERGGGQLDDLFSKEKFAWSADWFAAAPNMPHKGNPPTVTAYFSRIQTELMVDVFPLGEDLFACAYKQYSQPTDSEKALNREIMMLGNFLTGSNVGTWEWNIQTGETDFNERWAEIIGYSLAELQPINIDTWIKFSHPNDIKQSEVALQRHFAGETEFYDNESRMKHKDGSWVWIHDRGKVFEWQADGSPLMMYGSHTDITKQKMVELALVESELRFNLALEGANIGLWDWDMKQNYVYFSPEYKKILGYAEHEFPNKYESWQNAWHPQDKAKIESAVEDYLHGKTAKHELTHRLMHKDGTYRWILSRGFIQKDGDGLPTRFIGTIIDITDLTREREANAELQQFFDLSQELMAIVGEEGGSNKFNHAWSDILGYGKEELRSLNLQDLIHPDEASLQLGLLEQSITSGQRIKQINRFRCKDGTYRVIEWFIQPFENKLDVTGRDISDRLEKEKFISEESARLKTTLDQIPAMIWTAKANGTVDYINSVWLDFTGLSEQEALRTGLLTAVHPQDLPKVESEWAEILQNDQKLGEIVARYRRVDGEYRWHLVRVQPATDEKGRITKWYGSNVDISELVEAERKLKESQEMLLKYADQVPGMLYQFEITPDGRFRVPFSSRAIEDIFGCTPEEVLEDFSPVARTIHPQDMKEIEASIQKSASELSQFIAEYRVEIPGQPVRWVFAKSQPEKLSNGSIMFYGFNTDITPIKLTEQRLLEEKKLFSTTVNAAGEGIFVTDNQGSIILVNPMAKKIFGFGSDELLNKKIGDVFSIVDNETNETLPDFIGLVLNSGEVFEFGNPVRWLREGIVESPFITGTVAPIISADDKISGVVVTFNDISKEMMLEKEIEGFLNVNLDMLCVADMNGILIRVNKKFEEVLGYSSKELEGMSFFLLIHTDDIEATKAALTELDNGKNFFGFINRFRCKDGNYKNIEWQSQTGAGNYIYASARDVSEKVRFEEYLKNLATKDELTGLYNRHTFEAQINDRLEHADRYNEPLSLFIFDLDHFKRVNDTFGHQIGDEVLKTMARTIEQSVRDADMIVRFGGEEFMVLMPHTDLAGATAAAEKFRITVENTSFPEVEKITVSVGVSERANSESYRHWFRRTDEALYRVKESGRNRVTASLADEKPNIATVHIDWNHTWESGNITIDSQHQGLIDLGNKLFFSFLSEAKHQEVIKHLDTLLEHIVDHFHDEEEILKESGYPEASTHAGVHKNLVSKALRVKESYNRGEVSASSFFSFVVDDVVLGHMIRTDSKFFPYVKKDTVLPKEN